MQIRQLEMLRSVIRRSSYSAAAAELGLTQPAVSMQMKALAQEIGAPLFELRGRRLEPTPAAQVLASYSERILQLLEDAAAAARAGVPDSTVLHVAASSTPGALLPLRIAAFRARVPKTIVRLQVQNSRAVEALVSSGQADVGVIGSVLSNPALRSEYWADDQLVVIARPDHALARRRRVAPDELASETLLLREAGSATRATLEAAFLRANTPMPQTQVLGDTEALKHAVAAGLGVAFVSDISVRAELDTGGLCTLRMHGLDLRRPLSILLQGEGESEPVREFVEFLRAHPPRARARRHRSGAARPTRSE